MTSSDVKREEESHDPKVYVPLASKSGVTRRNENAPTNEVKERKPFDLAEELKKPHIVGIKPEYLEH